VDVDAEHRPLVSAGTAQYKFDVDLRRPDYRLVISADALFPDGASEASHHIAVSPAKPNPESSRSVNLLPSDST
jgi:hypothetical protein